MKEHKLDRNREVKPSKNRPERPDNGTKSLKEQGLNSGAWKNNSHRRESFPQHA